MKIYRVLSKIEYENFLQNKSIFNPSQIRYSPSGMLFPENADPFGKFFFFELEDIYNFVYSFASDEYGPDAVILELDIDRDTAMKYVAVADYIYHDPTKNIKKASQEELKKFRFRQDFFYYHTIPELFVDHELVDSKIRNGECRIIPTDTILKYNSSHPSYYEAERNPKTLELAKKLDQIWRLRGRINELNFNITYYGSFSEILNGEMEQAEAKQRALDELKSLSEKLDSLIEETKTFFKEFEREHEKYMALVPVSERQP